MVKQKRDYRVLKNVDTLRADWLKPVALLLWFPMS